MERLNIDIETRSLKDLSKTGVYPYARSPGFKVLLFGVSVDGGPVKVYDLMAGDKIPKEIVDALNDPKVTKWAFNSMFERICLSVHLGYQLNPEGWHCSMVASLYLGLPGSLAMVGSVLGLEKQKLETGKDLIKLFCVAKVNKETGDTYFVSPEDEPEKWKQFIEYNKRDVETEMEILSKVLKIPLPDFLWRQFYLDQKINDTGIKLDMEFVNRAMECDELCRGKYLARAQELTGLDNPNSPMQLKDWLASKGVEATGLTKADVAEMMGEATGDVLEVLELRQLLSKSSVKKYVAMANCICDDGRVHALLQFYGANRTGRWAGRLVQVQNLVANRMPDLKEARDIIKGGFFEAAEFLYDSVPDVLSQLVRTAFIPKEGCKFIVADFSAIEARVIAWLAGESWRMEAFKANKDIYCESASQMFGVPVVKNGENGHLRKKGKVAELALGYGGSVGALTAMGALDQGLTEDELKPLVELWRSRNPAIVKLWWDIDKEILTCLRNHEIRRYRCLTFSYESGILFIGLPSGRRLAYVRPKITRNEFDRDEMSYEGIGTNKHWERISTYGPKAVENIIQAISRDLLAEAMERLDEAGYTIVMHVHDEAVIEAKMDDSVDEVCKIMSVTPDWAEGLILNVAGYECEFYQKD